MLPHRRQLIVQCRQFRLRVACYRVRDIAGLSQSVFEFSYLGEASIPPSFQFAGDQTILRVYSVELAPCSIRFVSRAFDASSRDAFFASSSARVLAATLIAASIPTG